MRQDKGEDNINTFGLAFELDLGFSLESICLWIYLVTGSFPVSSKSSNVQRPDKMVNIKI